MPTVLILGAGINGCALARELALNGVNVCVVDQADISYGATAYSSRLIHGGLRYLEYGEFDLVRESLGERTRLLRLAPQFVKPLELFIPVDNRFVGLSSAAGRFLGWNWLTPKGPTKRRGMWLVRMGLWFYDKYARDPSLPKHRAHSGSERVMPCVDRERFRWLLSYYDAQVLYPERFTVALLTDARRAATERQSRLEVYTYHRARLDGKRVAIEPIAKPSDIAASFEPAAIVNATGAWVDLTLAELNVSAGRLMGGTKGSHIVTHHAPLRECLDGRGVYAEAADARPVFILPFGSGTLVGTTDEPFEGDPATAVATDDELDYLVETVNEIMPAARLSRDDVDLHYSGVRPLPHADAATPGAITRRHWMQEHREAPLPFYSIIGGKLTTCRSLAEESAREILRRLKLAVKATSSDRALPGGENYPRGQEIVRRWQRLAVQSGLTVDQVAAMWTLCGTEVETILAIGGAAAETLPGTELTVDYARWVIRHEWVTTLDDLVERRLMLVFAKELSEACLIRLAGLLAEEGRLPSDGVEATVAGTIRRLETHFGRRVLAAAKR